MTIKNIIFDLGGVIINIDYNKTLDAFRKLGVTGIEAVYNQSKQDSLFDDFDTGKVKAAEFRERLTDKFDLRISDQEFDQAWNAMLLDLPMSRLEFVKSLREKNYKTYLFSNINEIHYPEVFDICNKENGIDNFDEYFDMQYYSHIFGQRKPNPQAFIAILNENGLLAEETLFIDDSIQHVLGARDSGLHAIHLTGEKTLECILDYINELPREAEQNHGYLVSCSFGK